MAFGYLIVALLAAGVAVFALQNGAPTPVRFLAWNLEGLPLAGLILGALAAGLLIAGIPLGIQRWKARARVRRLEARVNELEARAAMPAQLPSAPTPRGSAPSAPPPAGGTRP
jgi:uncharacterized integral membrane protein